MDFGVTGFGAGCWDCVRSAADFFSGL